MTRQLPPPLECIYLSSIFCFLTSHNYAVPIIARSIFADHKILVRKWINAVVFFTRLLPCLAPPDRAQMLKIEMAVLCHDNMMYCF